MKHCWHPTGISKLINPAKYEDICCNCGKKRWRTETPLGHGKYFPGKNVLSGSKEEESKPYEFEECK